MLALYRKYRPKGFKDIVGQEEITTILKNQIINNKLSHAYLFCGTRGTGKTSTAKVLSKTLNCMNITDGEPCGVCETCIDDSSSFDIIELDAATNNGVDDIRKINDSVQYPPSKGSYKIYIIDEVHMLSKGAFNALLKTLEEPPKYVVFILATTEPNKIPATIRSRCQIYSFNRINTKDMISRLQYVCGEEKIVADTEALELIAINSDGAMRDALSILDQLSSITKSITADIVRKKLGIVDINLILNMVEFILRLDISGTLNLYNYLIDKGQSSRQLVEQILQVLRDILVFSTSTDSNSIEGLVEYKNSIKSLSAISSPTALSVMVSRLSSLYNTLGNALNPTTVAEYELIKLCSPSLFVDVDSLLVKIDKLERELISIKETGKIIEVKKEVQVLELKEISINVESALSFNDSIPSAPVDEKENEVVGDTTIELPEESSIFDNPISNDEELTSFSNNDDAGSSSVDNSKDETNNLSNLNNTVVNVILENSHTEVKEGVLNIDVSIPLYSLVLSTLCKDDLDSLNIQYKTNEFF